jgi:UDP-hydrolysing UDP-N-acetyl-D-glucosamine 2-epimerase
MTGPGRTARICYVTGSRADYGLMTPVLRQLQSEGALQLIVTGMHLSPGFGETVTEIAADGFVIDRRVDIDIRADAGEADGRQAIATSTGRGVERLAGALTELSPDLVVVLGDRYEMLAATLAAFFLTLPIAHLHGGEVTHGSLDDSTRHAITKLSHYHLVSNEEARRRVIQLGEDPGRVWLTGAPGLDGVRTGDRATREELAAALDLPASERFVLVTYHPVTTDGTESDTGLEALIAALETLDDHAVVVTGANADAGGDEINRRLAGFAARHPTRVRVRASLGRRLYLTAMEACDAVIGNSSSGVTEAPFLKKPSVDIGTRQEGRPRASSVIGCTPDAGSIAAAIARALSPEFARIASEAVSLYGDGQSAPGIAALLTELAGRPVTAAKRFHDIP